MARGKVCARILQPLLRRLSTAQGKQRKGKARDDAPERIDMDDTDESELSELDDSNEEDNRGPAPASKKSASSSASKKVWTQYLLVGATVAH